MRPIDIIAPPGTVVNVRHPGRVRRRPDGAAAAHHRADPGHASSARSCPSACSAASGGTSGNFLFGGVHPRTGEYYTHYHFEGIGWGGRATTDGNDAQIVPARQLPQHARRGLRDALPVVHRALRLNADGGGPGRTRGGLGITRVLTVEADEIVVSALCDRSRVAPWGLFGGDEGETTRLPGANAAARTSSARSRRRSGRLATRSSRTCACGAATRCCCARRPAAATGRRGSDPEPSPGTSRGLRHARACSGRYGGRRPAGRRIDPEGTFRARSALRAGDALG